MNRYISVAYLLSFTCATFLTISPCFAFTNVSGTTSVYLHPWGGGEFRDNKEGSNSFNIASTVTASTVSPSSSAHVTASASASVSKAFAQGTITASLSGGGLGNYYAATGGSVTCTTCLGGTFRQSYSSNLTGWRTTIPGGQTVMEEEVHANQTRTALFQIGSSASPSHVNPALFGTGSGTLNWSFVEESPDGILRGKNYPSHITYPNLNQVRHSLNWIRNPAQPAEMIVTFEPMNRFGESIQLDCLARELGFDHFNWEQTFHPPQNWKMLERRSIGGRLFPSSAPYYDPPVLPAQLYFVDHGSLPVPVNLPDSGQSDGLTAYYGETQDLWKAHYLDSFVDSVRGAVFEFTDVPAASQGMLVDSNNNGKFDGNEVMRFTTRLVGIKMVNGKEEVVSLGRNGVSFTWKSDAVTADGFVRLSGDEDIQIVSGGVFDVQFFTVPEPSGLALASIVAVLVVLRRRSTRAHN